MKLAQSSEARTPIQNEKRCWNVEWLEKCHITTNVRFVSPSIIHFPLGTEKRYTRQCPKARASRVKPPHKYFFYFTHLNFWGVWPSWARRTNRCRFDIWRVETKWCWVIGKMPHGHRSRTCVSLNHTFVSGLKNWPCAIAQGLADQSVHPTVAVWDRTVDNLLSVDVYHCPNSQKGYRYKHDESEYSCVKAVILTKFVSKIH